MATLTSEPERLDKTLTPLEHARRIAGLAQEKLAQDVLILDMRPVCSYTDFFVLATGQNPRQTKAIWDEVHERLKHDERRAAALGRRRAARGAGSSPTTSTCVFHVFTPESREYYRLEELWGDVPSVELASATASATIRADQGAVAQLGERLAGSQKVTGSSPVGSTPDV